MTTMRPTPLALLAAAVVALTPTGSAADGTESNPEVIDPSGDIRYHPLSQRGHEYLDVLSAWFDYDNQTDNVTLTLKVGAAQSLQNPSRDWLIECEVTTEVWMDADEKGTLVYEWRIQSNAMGQPPQLRPRVFYRPGADAGVSANTEIELRHDFAARYEAPGYFTFSSGRAGLLQHGDEARKTGAYCHEYFQPAQVPIYQNWDGASSNSTYSFRLLRRLASPDGQRDPFESVTETSSPAPNSEPGRGVPQLGAIAVFVAWALGSLIAWGRRGSP